MSRRTIEDPVRRPLLLALSALLVLGMVPAAAQSADSQEEPAVEEEVELVECDNPDGLEVITRDGLASDIATPSSFAGNETEFKEFLLDLSPATAETVGTVTTTMTWSVPTNDYDLSVYSSRGSAATEAFQPFDAPVEQASIPARHCDMFEVGAIDFLAPVVVDSLSLDFAVSEVPDFPEASVEG
jgi:hypothetical protein